MFSKRVADVGALETVTVTGEEVAVLAAASRATAVSVCAPSASVVVSQATEYGDVVSSAPICTPSGEEPDPHDADVVRGVGAHRGDAPDRGPGAEEP